VGEKIGLKVGLKKIGGALCKYHAPHDALQVSLKAELVHSFSLGMTGLKARYRSACGMFCP